MKQLLQEAYMVIVSFQHHYIFPQIIHLWQTKYHCKQWVLFDCRNDGIFKKWTCKAIVLLRSLLSILKYCVLLLIWLMCLKEELSLFGDKVTCILEMLLFFSLISLSLFFFASKSSQQETNSACSFPNTALLEDFDKLCNEGFSPQ